MNDRMMRLRARCMDAVPSLSGERAQLLTQFYQSAEAAHTSSVPVLRAKALRYLLEHQTIVIDADELIVGERGPCPKAASTYPELCCHSLEDLRVLDTRDRNPFSVDDELRRAYEETHIPFWSGRSMRDRMFAALPEAWHAAFDAGVFTEFMEQRSPGHAVLDDKIYRWGMVDFKEHIAASRARIAGSNDPRRDRKLDELEAMDIACDALIRFGQRHAKRAAELAAQTDDPQRRRELEAIAAICTRVPAHAPRTFHEAVQMYWFVHLGVIVELNEWDSFNPGRLDQHLDPFYRRDLEAGRLTADDARELLECFWIKVSQQPAPPKVGVTDEQSATYNDFMLINVGGVDRDGADAVNELSYMILDVIEEMRLPFTGSCVQLSRENPDRFLHRALQVVRCGFGQPSIFNTDAIVAEFVRAGKSIEDARAGGPSGCVTISAFGKESCVLTGYMNWPKILELALHDGVDPATGRQLGPKTGDPRTFASFDELFVAYRAQLEYFVDVKIEGNTIIERLFAEHMPAPFLSVFVDDCIASGEDYNGPGPRYPTTYIQGVGLGTTADALAAMKALVFDRAELRMDHLLDALDADFAGADEVRRMLSHDAPRYGNDDDAADAVAVRLFDAYFDAIDGRPNSKGGAYRVNLLPTTVHVFFGSKVGATANGRRARTPLSDGISPTQGADVCGPTAVLQSAAKIDHVRTGGTLLNQRFLPSVLERESDLEKVGHLVRAYFRMNGHHLQFNVVGSDTLRDAQVHPERHRDLIVRVAGYSDYFHNLGEGLQEEIIARTAHVEW